MDMKQEFEKAKDLFNNISWPLAIVGIWPRNMTLFSKIKFFLFITYFSTHLAMELMDLATIISSLELVILNLMESGFQTMAMARTLVMRFDKSIPRILDEIEKNLIIKNFENQEEMKIFLEHFSKADNFFRIISWCAICTALMWYLLPLQTYLITRLMSGNAVLINPYRIYLFFNVTPIHRTIMVYLYQLPMAYTGLIYVTSYSFILGVVSFLCSQLAILTRRASIIQTDQIDLRIFFRNHTLKHVKLIIMLQNLNKAFEVVLLYDLIVTTVLIGLIIFKFLMNIENADPFGLMVLGSYVMSMTMLVYANCFMGEYLNTECTALLNAYYQSNWYEMSPGYKQALIICMINTREPLRITAGKFYTFSMESFAQIMKSSMVYVSILRTLS